MSIYPNGGSSPHIHTAVHALSDRPLHLASTGVKVTEAIVVAAVVIGVGVLLWALCYLGRKHAEERMRRTGDPF